jgi:hypothetical protein
VEGGPDFLAALHFIGLAGVGVEVAPVAILGAGMSIDAEALPLLQGKRVRIFIDNDEAGCAAFARWSRQLAGVGAVVDGFDFSGLIRSNGEPAKDLNDCTQLSQASLSRWGATLSGMMKFAGVRADDPLPPGPPGGWWTAPERAAFMGTEIEGDSIIEEVARRFSARVILPEWKQNKEPAAGSDFTKDPFIKEVLRRFNEEIKPGGSSCPA